MQVFMDRFNPIIPNTVATGSIMSGMSAVPQTDAEVRVMVDVIQQHLQNFRQPVARHRAPGVLDRPDTACAI
jgi:hypothetical protein